MKKLTIFLALILGYSYVYAQVEVYGRYTINGTVEPDINIYGTKKISEKFDFTYFALVEKGWATLYLGISYSPEKWISVGLSAGIEQNPALYRIAGSVWLGKEKNSLLLLWEKGDGANNYWYRITASHKFSEEFSLSARAWRFHGVGPIVEYTLEKSDLTFWLLPAYDLEFKAKRLIVGLAVKI